MTPVLVSRLHEVPDPAAPLLLAIGAFDGLHRGHAEVIRFAQQQGGRTGVLRFLPHPARILRPMDAPPLLCTETQIHGLLGTLGVDVHIRLPFDLDFAGREPERFLQDLHEALPGLQGVVVGPDWRFGKSGRGDIHLLRKFAQRHHFAVHILPDTLWKGERISSTRIRHALLAGNLPEATAMLGRPYRLDGVVQPGKQYGRKLGFPTANFHPEQELMPPGGVYAMRVYGLDRPYIGAGYITHHPNLVEVHVLDFAGDLYGRHLEVDLIGFRRPASPILDHEQLQRTIREDVDAIREQLEARE